MTTDSLPLLDAMEERYSMLVMGYRNYRAMLVSEKLVKIHALRKEREMTTGNKSYRRSFRKGKRGKK